LIIMTPKSLLRHKLAVSARDDLTGEGHFKRLLSDLNPPAAGATTRLVLCSGKVGYELMEARDAASDTTTEIVRVEQLYPFPSEPLVKRLCNMPKLAELVWCQEEPKNNGSWFFVEPILEQCLAEAGLANRRSRYAGRSASASPATGLAKRHAAEQAALIADALGQSSAITAKAS
jgi:2-oxoglutarate dehydrogenase E1 component